MTTQDRAQAAEAERVQAATHKKSLSVQAEPVAFIVVLDGKPIAMAVPVENVDRLSGMHGAPLYTHPAPDHTALLRQALDALRLPCDRWNKQQTLIVNDTIAAIEGALK